MTKKGKKNCKFWGKISSSFVIYQGFAFLTLYRTLPWQTPKKPKSELEYLLIRLQKLTNWTARKRIAEGQSLNASVRRSSLSNFAFKHVILHSRNYDLPCPNLPKIPSLRDTPFRALSSITLHFGSLHSGHFHFQKPFTTWYSIQRIVWNFVYAQASRLRVENPKAVSAISLSYQMLSQKF